MVDIKKFFDKPTFVLISSAWTAASSYIVETLSQNPALSAIIVTIGNLVIVYISTETHQDAKTAS
jgi:hypothetical protein